MKAAFVLLTLLLFDQGCLDQKSKDTKAAAAPKTRLPPLHRFVLARIPMNDGVAFDTVTGQLCKTWEWEAVKSSGFAQPSSTIGEFAPTCLSVYEKYPSIGSGEYSPEDLQTAEPETK